MPTSGAFAPPPPTPPPVPPPIGFSVTGVVAVAQSALADAETASFGAAVYAAVQATVSATGADEQASTTITVEVVDVSKATVATCELDVSSAADRVKLVDSVHQSASDGLNGECTVTLQDIDRRSRRQLQASAQVELTVVRTYDYAQSPGATTAVADRIAAGVAAADPSARVASLALTDLRAQTTVQVSGTTDGSSLDETLADTAVLDAQFALRLPSLALNVSTPLVLTPPPPPRPPPPTAPPSTEPTSAAPIAPVNTPLKEASNSTMMLSIAIMVGAALIFASTLVVARYPRVRDVMRSLRKVAPNPISPTRAAPSQDTAAGAGATVRADAEEEVGASYGRSRQRVLPPGEPAEHLATPAPVPPLAALMPTTHAGGALRGEERGRWSLQSCCATTDDGPTSLAVEPPFAAAQPPARIALAPSAPRMVERLPPQAASLATSTGAERASYAVPTRLDFSSHGLNTVAPASPSPHPALGASEGPSGVSKPLPSVVGGARLSTSSADRLSMGECTTGGRDEQMAVMINHQLEAHKAATAVPLLENPQVQALPFASKPRARGLTAPPRPAPMLPPVAKTAAAEAGEVPVQSEASPSKPSARLPLHVRPQPRPDGAADMVIVGPPTRCQDPEPEDVAAPECAGDAVGRRWRPRGDPRAGA